MKAKVQIASVIIIFLLGIFLGVWFTLPVRNAVVKLTETPPAKLAKTTAGDIFKKQLELEERENQEILLPILVYHYVEYVTDEKDTIRKSMNITPAVFESQITTLLNDGYTTIRVSDLMKYFFGVADLPKKPVILTFDDGYRDFYTDVLPLIKKYQIQVEAYVVSGFLNKTKNYLTKEELHEIDASGLVEIGAHTVNHLNLRYISEKEAESEMTKSKIELEALLGHPVDQFAFPYGGYTLKLSEIAKQLGFQTAATTDRGVVQSFANRFALRRTRPGASTGEYLLSLIK